MILFVSVTYDYSSTSYWTSFSRVTTVLTDSGFWDKGATACFQCFRRSLEGKVWTWHWQIHKQDKTRWFCRPSEMQKVVNLIRQTCAGEYVRADHYNGCHHGDSSDYKLCIQQLFGAPFILWKARKEDWLGNLPWIIQQRGSKSRVITVSVEDVVFVLVSVLEPCLWMKNSTTTGGWFGGHWHDCSNCSGVDSGLRSRVWQRHNEGVGRADTRCDE